MLPFNPTVILGYNTNYINVDAWLQLAMSALQLCQIGISQTPPIITLSPF